MRTKVSFHAVTLASLASVIGCFLVVRVETIEAKIAVGALTVCALLATLAISHLDGTWAEEKC